MILALRDISKIIDQVKAKIFICSEEVSCLHSTEAKKNSDVILCNCREILKKILLLQLNYNCKGMTFCYVSNRKESNDRYFH